MKYKLSDITIKVTDGEHGTVKDNKDGQCYLLSCKNIKNGRIEIGQNERRIDEQTMRTLNKRTQLKKGDILLTTVGTIGEMAMIRDDRIYYSFQRSVGVIKPDILKVIPEYLYYAIANEINQINTLIKGAVQKCLFINDLKTLEIDLPDLETQRKIVRILSTLDQKIELNNQQNQTLMETALSVYRNRFRGPDNSNSKMIEWSEGFINDGVLTKIVKSGVDEYIGNKKYVATADVDGIYIKNYELVDFKEKPSRANMTPSRNTVWFAKMEGSSKNIIVADYCNDLIEDYIFSTGFMGIKCLNNSLYYIWCYINDNIFLDIKNSLSTGTLMAGISNSTIVKAKYAIPDQKLLQEFNAIVSPMFKKIYKNTIENETLKVMRDKLLPKLMSGEINLERAY